MNKIICITGMHRSGTSLVASWLDKCGVKIHTGKLMEGGLGNPKGHFEDIDFYLLQSKAILSEIPESKGWKYFEGISMQFKKNYLIEANKLISDRNRIYNLWGWKDPRSIVFLKQWKQVIPNLKTIIVWRPCHQVVHSLVKRSRKSSRNSITKIGIMESVKLWVSYNKMACAFKEEYANDTILLPLSKIIKNDREIVKIIRDVLDINLDYQSINSVFEKELLQKESNIFVRFADNIVSLSHSSRKIEDKLRSLSDI